jgi:hypothetical protein
MLACILHGSTLLTLGTVKLSTINHDQLLQWTGFCNRTVSHRST